MDEVTRGVSLLFVAAVCFGTLGVFGDFALSIGLPLGTLLSFRFGIAAVFVWLALAARGRTVVLRRKRALAAFCLGWLYASMTVLYFVSLEWLTVGVASLVLYTYPVPVFLISSVALDEPITRRKLLALVVVLLGVSLIVGADTAGATPVGVALAAAGAVAFAVYTTGSRALSGTVGSATQAAYNFVGATVCLLVYGTTIGRLSLPANPLEWSVVLGISTLGTVLPIGLLVMGLNRVTASRASIVGTVEPLTAVVLGIVLLDEHLTIPVVVGGALVLGGVGIANR